MTTPIRPIDPAQRSTLGSIVTDQLRDHVIHGRFKPGTVLGEVELAAQFGVSRGPIREALQRLVQEGLLRREPRRGISVPILTDADIADLYVAREAIEGAALDAVMSSDRDEVVGDLETIVDRMRAAVADADWVEVADLDMAFHRRIVEAAGSLRLTRLYANVIGETRICFNLTARYPGREHLVEEHAELAAFVATGDLSGARSSLTSHLSTSIATLSRHRPREADHVDSDRQRAVHRPARRRRPARSVR